LWVVGGPTSVCEHRRSADGSKADQPSPTQRLRHVTGDDPLGEALNDGGPADATLAIRTGLFLVRRDSTRTTWRISEFWPTAGSSLPSRARSVSRCRTCPATWWCPRPPASDPPVAAHLIERLQQRVRDDVERASCATARLSVDRREVTRDIDVVVYRLDIRTPDHGQAGLGGITTGDLVASCSWAARRRAQTRPALPAATRSTKLSWTCPRRPHTRNAGLPSRGPR